MDYYLFYHGMYIQLIRIHRVLPLYIVPIVVVRRILLAGLPGGQKPEAERRMSRDLWTSGRAVCPSLRCALCSAAASAAHSPLRVEIYVLELGNLAGQSTNPTKES